MDNSLFLNSPTCAAIRYLQDIVENFRLNRKAILAGEGKYRPSSMEHYGHVKLIIELKDYSEVFFSSKLLFEVTEDEIITEFHPWIVTGLNNFSLIFHVVQNNYQISNVRVVGGSFHDIDSRGSDYEVATYLAIKDAFSTVKK